MIHSQGPPGNLTIYCEAVADGTPATLCSQHVAERVEGEPIPFTQFLFFDPIAIFTSPCFHALLFTVHTDRVSGVLSWSRVKELQPPPSAA
jgi:hypothetical protein